MYQMACAIIEAFLKIVFMSLGSFAWPLINQSTTPQ